MSTIRVPFGTTDNTNAKNIGTNGAYGTVEEYGDGNYHKTVLTLAGAFRAIAGGADLGVGRLIYTFPA